MDLVNRQIIIANAIALKLVNFWFDAAQAQIRLVRGMQKT